MKRLTGTCVLALISLVNYAAHISGGEMYYKYLGVASNGNLRYEITLRLFRDCNVTGNSVAEMPDAVIIGIFQNTPPYTVAKKDISIPRTQFDRLELRSPSPCIINAPAICYQVGYFTTIQELPKNEEGYIAAYQTCCRISFISNTVANSPSQNRDPGATYVARIPGTKILGATGINSSPVFSVADTALVCRGNKMSVDFSAKDPDGDDLSYAFCSAYGSGTKPDSREAMPDTPEYGDVTYQPGYSGSNPMGTGVTIDPVTGIISGIAPTGGNIRPNGVSYFVVNVCVTERRGGIIIGVHRKDFIMKVTDCQLADAELPITSLTCDGFSFTFSNQNNSPLIKTYYWDFGVPGSTPSTDPTPSFTFPDTGKYTVKLIINKDGDCSDEATTTLGVYPGFQTDFTIQEGCVDIPVNFFDNTASQYGAVNYWKWDFGDLNTTLDVSSNQNPSYKYNVSGQKNATLISGNDKGCRDTLAIPFTLLDKPIVKLAFRDTLICDIDTLQLHINGPGTYVWSPDYMISDLNIPDPLVSPDLSFTYIVDMDYLGCKARDSVRVNVVDRVTLNAGTDTTICRTDPVTLRPITDALYFLWTPSATLNRNDVKNPVATPTSEFTLYTVRGSIGKCYTEDDVLITTAPYPIVNAGQDHTICTDSLVVLTGTHDADVFSWSPSATLLNANTLSPTAFPSVTSNYYLTARYLTGCKKPVTDTALIRVIPPVPAFAGNDTAIVLGQPLQLTATGGALYEWNPPLGLTNTRIFNPVASLTTDQVYSVKVITPENCYAFDTVAVRVFKTAPDIFVPNAFSPNGDGHNDVFRPLAVGIAQYDYFRVYNRWGELVFSTRIPGEGWDGKINGQAQGTGTFVWHVQGTDYTGKKVFRKGTVVLVK